MDEGANGQITYYINHQSDNTKELFKIDENYGEISVIGAAGPREVLVVRDGSAGGGRWRVRPAHCKVVIEMMT